MRLVIQRVAEASVSLEGECISAIDRGLLLLVGITETDTSKEVRTLIDKTIGLRIFPDASGKMNKSLFDIGGQVLIVSQFTLYGDASKGRRPSFVHAARPETAHPLYTECLEYAESRLGPGKVAGGAFGEAMQVALVNDGPVTILLDA